MLARYAVIRAGETPAIDTRATGLIGYVLRGAGTTSAFALAAGDVVLLPGGAVALTAAEHAVLSLVGNEPFLAFGRCAPASFPAEIR